MRRRALLAAAAGIASVTGCLGGDDGEQTTDGETTTRGVTETATSTPTATGTETATPPPTVAPDRRGRILEGLSAAATALDDGVRAQSLTGPDPEFDPATVEEPLGRARTAVDEVPAERADAVAPLTAVADAVAAALDAATPYADAVVALREVESRHTIRRFGAAADRFERAATAHETAASAAAEATTLVEEIPDGIDREATGLATLESALGHLDGALTATGALAAGGVPLENGAEAFAVGEERFSAGEYRSAAAAYRDAGGEFDDAVDGFATEAALEEFPESFASSLDTHRCRAEAYAAAAEGMLAASETGEVTDDYRSARTALVEDCVALSWPEPAE